MSQEAYLNKIIFSKYQIIKRIGKGSFGTVYLGRVISTEEKVAIKMEKREKSSQGTLETEAYRLIYLQNEGIPKIYCYGNNQTHNILVQELLGKSLEEIFNSCKKKFSLKTVCVLGIEMITRIKYVHSKYHIHRDIKPDNFMTGINENENKIYIIDFGLSKKYYSTSKKQHIKFSTGKSLTGTARYCARNAHRGFEQSRRDDIESIGYVLMYFLLGSLPWQGLKIKPGEDQFKKIAEKKINTSFEFLTKGHPDEFLKYFKYCDQLNFEDQPDYEFLIGLFQTMINKYCNNCFYDFDWKKNFLEHLSLEQEKNNTLDFIKNDLLNKSRDVSLIVNKNNESKNEKENDNEDDNEVKNHLRNSKVFIQETTEEDTDYQIGNSKNNNNYNSNNFKNNNNNSNRNNNYVKKKKIRSNSTLNIHLNGKKNYDENDVSFNEDYNNNNNNNYYNNENNEIDENYKMKKYKSNKEEPTPLFQNLSSRNIQKKNSKKVIKGELNNEYYQTNNTNLRGNGFMSNKKISKSIKTIEIETTERQNNDGILNEIKIEEKYNDINEKKELNINDINLNNINEKSKEHIKRRRQRTKSMDDKLGEIQTNTKCKCIIF